jgi:hypothetical protein
MLLVRRKMPGQQPWLWNTSTLSGFVPAIGRAGEAFGQDVR